MKKLLLLLLLLTIVFASCELIPDEDGGYCPDKSQMLSYKIVNKKPVQKKWVGEYYLQGYRFLPTCLEDAEIYFVQGGFIYELEGATRCLPTDPDTLDKGTWKYECDLIKLNTKNFSNTDFVVKKLTMDTVVAKFYWNDIGDSVEFRCKSY